MFDYESRVRKAKKAISVIKDYLQDTKQCNVLDIGCSTGIMTNVYSEHFDKIIGIDIDKEAIKYASENFKNKNLTFITASFNDINIEKDDLILLPAHIYMNK